MAEYESQSQEVLGNHIRLGIIDEHGPARVANPSSIERWTVGYVL